jgi:hypothetical protein
MRPVSALAARTRRTSTTFAPIAPPAANSTSGSRWTGVLTVPGPASAPGTTGSTAELSRPRATNDMSPSRGRRPARRGLKQVSRHGPARMTRFSIAHQEVPRRPGHAITSRTLGPAMGSTPHFAKEGSDPMPTTAPPASSGRSLTIWRKTDALFSARSPRARHSRGAADRGRRRQPVSVVGGRPRGLKSLCVTAQSATAMTNATRRQGPRRLIDGRSMRWAASVWAGSLRLDRQLAEGASPARSPELSLHAKLSSDRLPCRHPVAAVDAARRSRSRRALGAAISPSLEGRAPAIASRSMLNQPRSAGHNRRSAVTVQLAQPRSASRL